MPENKRCNACGETKPLAAFGHQARTRDGHATQCKACTNERQREKPRKRNKERERIAKARWKRAHHRKIKAHSLVQKAVGRGQLAKPSRCTRCGCASWLHAHHTDYDRPLDVAWLCPLCHKAVHAEEVGIAA